MARKKRTDGEAPEVQPQQHEQQQGPQAEAQGQQAPVQGDRRPPAHEVRFGRIKAVIWENHSTTQGRWYSITCGRSYKDEKSGQWKTASSFGRDDLLVLAECLRQCYLWIAHATSAQAGNGANANNGNGNHGSTAHCGDDIPF